MGTFDTTRVMYSADGKIYRIPNDTLGLFPNGILMGRPGVRSFIDMGSENSTDGEDERWGPYINMRSKDGYWHTSGNRGPEDNDMGVWWNNRKDNARTQAIRYKKDGTVIAAQAGNGQGIAMTQGWHGFPDNSQMSELSNDLVGFKQLMIVGNKSRDGNTRSVGVWDRLEVHGALDADRYSGLGGRLRTFNNKLVVPKQNLDYPGGDLSNLRVRNEDECINECTKIDQAVSAVYNKKDSWCWCKGHIANPRVDNNANANILL